MTADRTWEFAEYWQTEVDPVGLAIDWYATATAMDVREPRSFSLATTGNDGVVTARILAALSVDRQGVEFATHSCSRKVTDIGERNSANALFYWREVGRQLSLSGKVETCSLARADEVWLGRPAALDSMSSVSWQSTPLEEPATLLDAEAAARTEARLTRPERFVVYRLVPERIEFWAVSSDRLHRRLACTWRNGTWSSVRLQP